MSTLTLIIGNKNYSSWSLRAGLALMRTGLAFEEVIIPLGTPETEGAIAAHSPSGKVPVLRDGGRTVWESLAICEYLAEKAPAAGLWPADAEARAVARTVSAEMHAGFENLRTHMPMNVRGRFPGKGRAAGVDGDIARIAAIWASCRERYGAGGDLLFGGFTIADAMFAPVVSRFRTYAVDLPEPGRAYCDAVWALPEMQAWAAAARDEPWTNPTYEF